ncbi:MAG: UbiA family prenyltransferase [archaeon]
MALKDFIELTRPSNVLLAVLAVILTFFVSKGIFFSFFVTLPAIICVGCITAAGNVANDYYDIKIDKVNRPGRPLPSKRVSLKNAKAFAAFLFAIGVFSSLFLPLICVLIAVSNSLLLVVYAYLLKRSGFLGNILVSYMIASLFIFSAAITSSMLIGAFLAVSAFLVSTAREVLKDMEDVRGDKVGGARTLATERGRKKTEFIVISFLLLAILFSPVPFLAGFFSVWYLAVALAADALFIRVIFQMSKSSIRIDRAQAKLLNFGLVVLMFAFFAGAISLVI